MKNVLIEHQSEFLASFFCDFTLTNVTIRHSSPYSSMFEMLDTNLTLIESHMYNITALPTTVTLIYSDKNSRINLLRGTIIEDIVCPVLLS